MAKHHPDLIFCRKQPGVSIGRLCEKCDGKCVICSVLSWKRIETVVPKLSISAVLKLTYSMSERNMALKRDDIGFALYLGNSFYRKRSRIRQGPDFSVQDSRRLQH
nr:unnamed protein product [Spirometra erinaceieuropaei]